jgi:hypothetical protein
VNDLKTAAEIAALKLPGLPTSKVGVRALAEREGWTFEERKGVGGTRRVYSLPARYLANTSYAAPEVARIIGAIAPSGRADPALLSTAIQAFEEFCESKGVVFTAERKAAVIALLYDYLVKGAGPQEVESFFKAVG